MIEPKIYTLLGRAGCGKGTQAKLLTERFGLFYIGSGELLRDLTKSGGWSGQKADQMMKVGELVPTSLISMLWENRLEELKKQPDFSGLVFDGCPRKLIEAYLLDEALVWYEWNKNFKVILVDISREEAIHRLAKRRQCVKCGQLIPYVGTYKDLVVCDQCGGQLVARQDDTAEAINKRLDLFEEEVMPVVAYYDKKGWLVRINGEQSIEGVQKEILEKIS